MDEEIKDLIKNYVTQIESKEADIVLLKNKIDKIIFDAQGEMKNLLASLESKFNENKITEEQYLAMVREEKRNLLQKTKEKLETLSHTESES